VARNIIPPKDIKAGMTIRDKFGEEGIVEINMHPWGFQRLQYSGLTVINHEDPEWYELIKDDSANYSQELSEEQSATMMEKYNTLIKSALVIGIPDFIISK